jgi:pilus assembly protein Flp/PilA
MRGRRQECAVRRLLARFAADQSGATSIEYALIAVGISIVIIGAVTSIGTNLSGKYTTVNSTIK